MEEACGYDWAGACCWKVVSDVRVTFFAEWERPCTEDICLHGNHGGFCMVEIVAQGVILRKGLVVSIHVFKLETS